MNHLPIVYSVHHASHDFGFEGFDERCALTPEQRTRFSDYGTAETVPQQGNITRALIARWSRGIVDLNASNDWKQCFKTEDFAKADDRFTPRKNKIWRPGQEPTDQEKARIMQDIYYPYYGTLTNDLRKLEAHKELLVVGWDNTAGYGIGKDEAGNQVFMPDFIVSNRGAEGSAEEDTKGQTKGEPTTCAPQILELYAHNLRRALQDQGLPNEVHMNLVYRGGNIPRTFSHRRNPGLPVQATVQSLQMEYNTRITHDQKTLEAYPDHMVRLRVAAERAMYETYTNLLTHNVGVDLAGGAPGRER